MIDLDFVSRKNALWFAVNNLTPPLVPKENSRERGWTRSGGGVVHGWFSKAVG